MNQPPIRYRQTPSNWPPQGPPSSGPEYVSGGDGGGPGWFRWAVILGGSFIALLLVILAAGSLFGGSSTPQPKKVSVVRDERPKAKPNSWSREYGVSLQFGGKPTAMRSVRVSGLNGKNANVAYQVEGLCGGWITKPSSWLLSVSPANRKTIVHQAKQIKQVHVVGATCQYQVSFIWPSVYLHSTMMTVRMPSGKNASNNITLWLQIPDSHQGVDEL